MKVFRRTLELPSDSVCPFRHAGVGHAVRPLGVLEELADELRPSPGKVRSVAARVLPLGELLVGDLELGLVPSVTGKQREIAPHVVEVHLHGVALKLIRAHVSITVTH